MDLQKEWNNLGDELSARNSAPADYTLIRKESKSTYDKLYKTMKYKMVYAGVFSIIALALAFFAPTTIRYFLIGFFLAFQLGRILMMQKMKRLPKKIEYTEVTTTVLKNQLLVIRQVLNIEKVWGYVFITLSALAGLIMYKLSIGKPLEVIMREPGFIYQVLICLVVSGAFNLLGEKMNNLAFSSNLLKISENLKQLED